MALSYTLSSAEALANAHPLTFEIPSLESRSNIKTDGDAHAKLLFTDGEKTERMWVQVTDKRGDTYTGLLSNEPVFLSPAYGDLVEFKAEHIADIMWS